MITNSTNTHKTTTTPPHGTRHQMALLPFTPKSSWREGFGEAENRLAIPFPMDPTLSKGFLEVEGGLAGSRVPGEGAAPTMALALVFCWRIL